MTKIAIVYHSGYGHTAKVAEHVRKGATTTGTEVTLYKAEDLASPDTGPWDELAAADAIIFGAPTYMGSASAPMKQFMDASSKAWFTDAWKDKIAAGFTNSGSLAGDKSGTLAQFATHFVGQLIGLVMVEAALDQVMDEHAPHEGDTLLAVDDKRHRVTVPRLCGTGKRI